MCSIVLWLKIAQKENDMKERKRVFGRFAGDSTWRAIQVNEATWSSWVKKGEE